MLQRSWSSPSCFGQSFTLVSAPVKRRSKLDWGFKFLFNFSVAISNRYGSLIWHLWRDNEKTFAWKTSKGTLRRSYFGRLCTQPHSFGHYQTLTIDESWHLNRRVKWEPSGSTLWIPQQSHFCRCCTNQPVHLTLHFPLIYEQEAEKLKPLCLGKPFTCHLPGTIRYFQVWNHWLRLEGCWLPSQLPHTQPPTPPEHAGGRTPKKPTKACHQQTAETRFPVLNLAVPQDPVHEYNGQERRKIVMLGADVINRFQTLYKITWVTQLWTKHIKTGWSDSQDPP